MQCSHISTFQQNNSFNSNLHVELDTESNKKVFVSDVGAVLKKNYMVRAPQQPLPNQSDSGFCALITRWNEHRLWNAEGCVDVQALNIFYSEKQDHTKLLSNIQTETIPVKRGNYYYYYFNTKLCTKHKQKPITQKCKLVVFLHI